MFSTQSTMADLLFFVLRLATIGLLYLFLLQLLRNILRELRRTAPAGDALPRYGRLIVVNPGQTRLPQGLPFALQALTTIGSNIENTIQVPDPTVSDRHAVIGWRGNQAWLEDLGSLNGTFLDQARVTHQVSLHEGALIDFGQVRFKWTRGVLVDEF